MSGERPLPGFAEEQAALATSCGEDELYEMTNIYPRTSGLPMTVWVSPRGHARHDVRVKVCRVPGDRMVPEETAVVSVRPRPSLMQGELDTAALAAVIAWTELNRDALVALWDGEIDGVELAQRLKRIGQP